MHSLNSATEKSHGTRLSDQSIDENMRKPIVSTSANDETNVSEFFDVEKLF